ncbi:RDD family protein [Aneurinibacillus terranovensis]|uniref:RDD family protein n=1 Tax=Aneurinibacillus terranovensis TaxID=278991 RepID=UPI001FDF828E|nr:RDD family protein [Aneurinibacillus terranovensis]
MKNKIIRFEDYILRRKGFSYSHFINRLLSFCIDSALYSIAFFFGFVLFEKYRGFSHFTMDQQVLYAFITGFLLYKISMECSPIKATVGKNLIGIEIVNKHGKRITFFQSLVRTAVISVLSILFLLFTKHTAVNTDFLFFSIPVFIPVCFTKKRQGLHDMLSRCFVVEKQQEGDSLKLNSKNQKKTVPIKISLR